MTSPARSLAAVVFVALAVFFVVYGQIPSWDGLTREHARVAEVAGRKNGWVEAVLVTESGARLTCKGKRGSVPALTGIANRCPVETIERHLGAEVTVRHDGQTPFHAEAEGTVIIDYAEHRQGRLAMIGLAALLLGMAALARWRR